ncbi:MAG: hypothetical protein ACFFDN_43595, partial [Candidatus Hodarchaeota archaeon]
TFYEDTVPEEKYTQEIVDNLKKIKGTSEGHQKDMEYIEGEWTDIKLLAIFKKDWKKRRSI